MPRPARLSFPDIGRVPNLPTGIYTRRSRDDQSSYSPAAQERIGRGFCEANQLKIAKLYLDDDYSGTNGDRPAFEQMQHDVRAGLIRVVVVPKMDRFARDVILCIQTYDLLRSLGAVVVSVAEPLDFDTPMGRKFLTDAASTAEWYSRNLATEVKKGLVEKWLRGGHNGYAPFGYQRIHTFDASGQRVRGTERLEQTEDIHIVERIRDLYITGCYSDGTLARELNSAGRTFLNPKTGERVAFQRDSVGGILTNRFYCGEVAYKGEWRKGTHKPIWTEQEFAQIQRIRERRRSPNAGARTGSRDRAMLPEIIYCAVCGGKMYYQPRQERGGHYFCSTRRKYGREGCGGRSIDQYHAEDAVTALFTDLALPDEVRQAVIHELRDRVNSSATPVLVDTTKIREQIRRLDVAYRVGADDLDDATYLATRERLQSQLAAASPTSPMVKLLDIAAAERLLADLPALFAQAAVARQRALLQFLVERMWFEGRSICALTPTPQGYEILRALGVAVRATSVTPTGFEPVAFSSGG